jgi:ligand-binding sensor domain-containing protein
MKFLVSCLCLLFTLTGFGQITNEVTHYSTKDGLSHDGVIAITRDREGFMWLGTFDGLNRFDGHSFVGYKSRPGDRSVLRSNKIRDIVEDKVGYLWIQTSDYKVYRFDKATEKFLALSEGSYKSLFNEQVIINKIIPDAVNGVWLLTKKHGLYYVQSHRAKLPVVIRFTQNEQGAFHLKGDLVKFHHMGTDG